MNKMPSEIDPIAVAPSVESVKAYLLSLQKDICQFVEREEQAGYAQPTVFQQDQWHHVEGGGGITQVLTQGNVFEKVGVNFSHVKGAQLPPAATLKRPELAASPFQALGVSVVMHPQNPYLPTTHFNVRFIVVEKDMPHWWFGGGFDMTPYYGNVEDCVHWHKHAYQACQPFGETLYPQYKKWADDYFFLPHRKEARGIGGIFFDDLNNWSFDRCFDFIKSVGSNYLLAYEPIVQKRKKTVYGERERAFQLYRRGRYVEFNLLYDRGTLFGLQSGGRTESILMSLPPLVAWEYDYQVQPNTPEHHLYHEFLLAKDWLALAKG